MKHSLMKYLFGRYRLALSCCGLLFLVNNVFANDATAIKQINQSELLLRLEKSDPSLVILDVRTAAEFAQGHVPGAINISHDQLANRISELHRFKDKNMVLYCRSGRRTALAAELLKANGFEKIFHLEGDMQQWLENNRPLAK